MFNREYIALLMSTKYGTQKVLYSSSFLSLCQQYIYFAAKTCDATKKNIISVCVLHKVSVAVCVHWHRTVWYVAAAVGVDMHIARASVRYHKRKHQFSTQSPVP